MVADLNCFIDDDTNMIIDFSSGDSIVLNDVAIDNTHYKDFFQIETPPLRGVNYAGFSHPTIRLVS